MHSCTVIHTSGQALVPILLFYNNAQLYSDSQENVCKCRYRKGKRHIAHTCHEMCLAETHFLNSWYMGLHQDFELTTGNQKQLVGPLNWYYIHGCTKFCGNLWGGRNSWGHAYQYGLTTPCNQPINDALMVLMHGNIIRVRSDDCWQLLANGWLKHNLSPGSLTSSANSDQCSLLAHICTHTWQYF